MPERIIIKTIALQGFRAFLRPQTFEFGADGKSLVVFAPNAKGKSSLVDGPEFFLSEEGTLARLGKIKGGNKAGREALQHAEATAKGVTGEVTLTFHDGTAPFGDTRRVVSTNYTRPASGDRVAAAIRVPILIRGYELRRFVEEQTPEDRYEEIASWFSLSRLVSLQTEIKNARSAMKKKVADNSIVTERTRDLVRITERTITVWSEPQVLAWLNENFVKPLDAALSLAALSVDDPTVAVLRTRKEEEEKRIGLDTLKDAISQIRRVHVTGAEPTGTIVSFEKSNQALVAARDHEAAEKTKAEKAVFRDVWEASEKLLNDKAVEMAACPVCETEFDKTKAGSREAVSAALTVHLGHLKTYREATLALEKAKKVMVENWNTLKTDLGKLQTLLKTAGHTAEAEAVVAYAKGVVEMGKTKIMPDGTALKAALAAVLPTIQAKHDALAKAQPKHNYAKTLATLNELVIVKAAMDRAAAKRDELVRLEHSLFLAGNSVDASIRTYIENIIATLRTDTNTLYRAIQGGTATCPVVRLELPPAEQVNQRQLSLMIDYVGRTGVAPSGYLSDSQVHTLALALRLAAIKRLNKTVAVIVLDDIVTSYDADHRRYIARMIADELKDYQVIVVTHDDRFNANLKDALPQASWQFKRIALLEPDFGPRFADHKTQEQEIVAAWDRGEFAANLIRQAEEEWLRRICLEFGVDMRFKDFGASYERSEYAQALMKFLREKRLNVPSIPGITNPFLTSLTTGTVENFGSHFQPNVYAWASIGDEQSRWNEFKQFRDLFKCPSCSRTRFTRAATQSLPQCERCQTPFAFAATPAAPAPAAHAAAPAAPAPDRGTALVVEVTGGQAAEPVAAGSTAAEERQA